MYSKKIQTCNYIGKKLVLNFSVIQLSFQINSGSVKLKKINKKNIMV